MASLRARPSTEALVLASSCRRTTRRARARPGDRMPKHEPSPPLAPRGAPENPVRAIAGDSKPAAARPSALGEIGFVGLGRMGAAMATNLAAKGRQVIAYVRRADRFGEL